MNTRTVEYTSPILYDYATGEPIRPATLEELEASVAAEKRDGGAGVILVNGKSCYVLE